jgi:predicted dehydrogenase
VTGVRVGVVGYGHLGAHHARALRRIEGATLAGVYDPSPEARARAASDLSVETFDRLDALLDRVEAVAIAAPTVAHAEAAERALARGAHVLVEKPIAATVAEGESMIRAARRAGRALLVGHVERYNPAVRAALPHLKSPRFIEAHRLAPIVPRGIDVDVVLDLMIHDLDLCLLATRSSVASVAAVGVPVLTPRVDIANARLTFESGCVANLTASRVSRDKLRKIRFFESSEYVSIDCLNRTVEAYTLAPGAGTGAEDWMRRIRPVPIEVPPLDPLETELRHFLSRLSDPDQALAEAAPALEALRVAEEIRAQIERRLPQGALV